MWKRIKISNSIPRHNSSVHQGNSISISIVNCTKEANTIWKIILRNHLPMMNFSVAKTEDKIFHIHADYSIYRSGVGVLCNVLCNRRKPGRGGSPYRGQY